jgi:arylsulfatase A
LFFRKYLMVSRLALFHSQEVLKLNRLFLVWVVLMATVLSSPAAGAPPPNIVYILCDDLGYGDVQCLNREGKILTPHMDRLAAAGMIFTDAHSSSSVCTPTRYSILTGRYNWRSAMKRGVLNGFSPRLIETGRATVASFLREQGYATACIGKWHLGMNWPQDDSTAPAPSDDPRRIDYSRPIEGGPNAVGFDYFYGISASLDMPPYAFIENDRVTEVPTVEKQWLRKGPAAGSFQAEAVLPTLTDKAVAYIGRRAAEAKQGKPFFLYLSLASPHTPILPTSEWQGKSGLNPYADFVMQTDATVGAVLDALDGQGLAENTLVIFTSDNGCSPEADFPTLRALGHDPSHHFRGHKADIFEGGHRIPFLVRWPARVKAGTSSDQLICLNDLFATCAEILGRTLPDHVAEDSVSFLPALTGSAKKPLREAVVHHSINGSFAIRQGKWKLVLCSDSGGWSEPRPGSAAALELPPVQLYDLSRDIGERVNVQARHPAVVAQMTKLLEKYVADGRSTPGKPQQNTGPVALYPGIKNSRANGAGTTASPAQKTK